MQITSLAWHIFIWRHFYSRERSYIILHRDRCWNTQEGG